ncbi:MAG: zinc ribbon domain-containing protein [Candidatus Delongbacteria bacterium]
MEQVKCPSCGASVGSGDASCRYCGESLSRSSQPNYSAPAQQPQVIVVNAQPNQQSSLPVYSSDKSKITAAILAFFLVV